MFGLARPKLPWLLWLFLFSIFPGVELQAAPVNDNFNNALVLAGSSILTAGNNLAATKENGEPNHGGNAGGASVWWTWTAPFSGGATLTTGGSDFNTVVGVYTGNTVSSLTAIASDGRQHLPCSVTFKATNGVSYRIAVDGYGGASGNILLGLSLTSSPANDDLTNHIEVPAGLAIGQNFGATTEPALQPIAAVPGGNSVWWSWTPTSNSCVTISTDGSDFDTALSASTVLDYFGFISLLPVAANDDLPDCVSSSITFNAEAGTNYVIGVDGYNRNAGNIALQITPFAGPPNDNFASPTILTGTNITVVGSNRGATAEIGEPDHNGNPASRSVWWQWQAPITGGATIDLNGTGFPTVIGVYTGSTLASLAPIKGGFDHAVFKAVAGTQYRIAVDSNTGGDVSGPIQLKLTCFPGLTNDYFTNVTFLGVNGGTQNGSNVGATSETNEPPQQMSLLLYPEVWGKTVWYSYATVLNLSGFISVISTNFTTTITLFTGNSLTNLTRVAAHLGTGSTNELDFKPVPRQLYYIAVDGNSGGEGLFTINGGLVSTGPTNDFFTNRLVLSGTNLLTTTRNTSASTESGEPAHGGVADIGSVWWTWNAPAAGRLFLTTKGSSFSTVMGLYQGTTVSSLTTRASAVTGDCPGFCTLNYDISSGKQAFQIAVAGETGSSTTVGSIDLSLRFVRAPANDGFNSRLALTGAFQSVTGSLAAASQETGEVIDGYSSGLRTVWYSWTAPDLGNPAGGVKLRLTGVNIGGTTNDPIVEVYQGNSVSALTQVPAVSELIGNVRQVSFQAQAGATYQIVVAGGVSLGNGIDTSFAKRQGGVPLDPLAETGSFVLRLNYSPLALRIKNVVPADLGIDTLGYRSLGTKVPFGAVALVTNYGGSASGPIRVRLLAMSSTGTIMGDINDYGAVGVDANGNFSIPVGGGCPPASAILAVLEEQMGTDWFFRDSSVVVAGLSLQSFLCFIEVGGGVTLLEPGISGQCFCPPKLTGVLIHGPVSVTEGTKASYWGTALFDNGSSPIFTNTAWTTTDTNRFPITTNGILTAGSVQADFSLNVTSYFSYLGVTQNTNKPVTVINLPPPQMINPVQLSDGSFQMTLQGVPGRQHVIEGATNLSPPVVWTSLSTNVTGTNGAQSGYFNFTDTTKNLDQRFYRAREN
jgi:hypothetical protein